ncbi:AraC family transcriptional regulator [Microbacterium lacus]|uniref:helix-turn-helix domain-containing protein n=1 Tax=Microbacterium lacus TaxID=415217 RepID=UPI00384D6284
MADLAIHLDDSLILPQYGRMQRPDGFDRQRLTVVPRPLVAAALARPVTRRMIVTDAGWFPRAEGHGRERPTGAAETIVIVCVAGTGWLEHDGTRTLVGAGGAIVIPRGVAHAYGAGTGDPWTIWWCHVGGSDTAELVDAMGVSGAVLTLSLRSIDRITAQLDEIVSALERDTTPARLIATAGMAWRLFTLLAVDRILPEDGTPLERAMRYLDERVDGRVQVNELAALVGVSPSHLSALFRGTTGGGVVAHHQSLKMARARHLLDTTDLTVAEIARLVGMDDPFYFSRQFRKVHGMSPTQYRATSKG